MKKVILITGSNKGIGFETARQLGKAGHLIILSGRNEARLSAAVEILKKENIVVESLLMDVAANQSVKHAAGELIRRKIRLDVLINNAGILVRNDRSIMTDDDEIIMNLLTTNSLSVLRVCRAFLPCMNNPSRIINISSGGGSMTDPVGGWSPVYCTSKTLLNSFTRQLASELRSVNISVNAVSPGWVHTDMGGAGASRSVEKGAETPVWLATEAPQNLTGKFFRDKREIPW